MKKSAIVLFIAALFSLHAMAQTVQEGTSHLFAERYQSARQTFEKLTTANPNNLEAVYWLGQTLIAQNDLAGARALYQRTLAANGNAPWVLAGMGHVNLLDGKTAEARQMFDAAIAAAKGKKGADVGILTAVGRANVQAYTDQKKLGDVEYAIARLNEAAQQAPNNPEIFVALGNAYRKLHRGGDAIQAYRKAGNYAPALHRIASLYQSQRNWDVVVENLNAAIAADARYAPAYEQLYDYYLRYKKDFSTAESFASKYISAADQSVENEYIIAQTKYVQNDFPGAIASASKIVSGSQNPRPRVYRLLAYSYLGAKDTASACTNSDLYLQKAAEEEIIGPDYILHATACGRGNPELIRSDIYMAVKKDSVLSRQIETLNEAIENAKANDNKLLEGELRLISYHLRNTQGGRVSPDELISYIAVPLYLGGNYEKADSVAQAYATAMPDSIHGFYWSALSRTAIDTNMQQGLAMPIWEKVLTVAEANKERFKSQGVRAATSLAVYNTNIKADRNTALEYVARGLAFDPVNENLQSIQKALTQASRTPAKTETKTKTTTAGGTQIKTKTKTKKD
jgi:Flp pilus assembly protein TadD